MFFENKGISSRTENVSLSTPYQSLCLLFRLPVTSCQRIYEYEISIHRTLAKYKIPQQLSIYVCTLLLMISQVLSNSLVGRFIEAKITIFKITETNSLETIRSPLTLTEFTYVRLLCFKYIYIYTPSRSLRDNNGNDFS